MNKKSLVVSYNDLEDDIAKPYFLYKALEESSQEAIFLINDSQRKKEFLNRYKAKYITFKKIQFVNFFYLVIGLYASFLPTYKINNSYEEVAFKSFCISSRHRVGGLRLIPKIKISQIRFRYLLTRTITIGYLFWKVSLHDRIKYVVLEERHKLPESFIYYIALMNKIPVIQYTRGPFKNSIAIKKLFHSNWWHHPLSDTEASFSKNIDDSNFPKDWEESLMQEFDKRYTDNHWYDRNLIVGANNTDSVESLFNDSKQDYVLIVPHILWDATFSYGENIFEDYLSWLIEVLELASKSNLSFICKLHPDLIWKTKRLSKGFDHLSFISDKISDLQATNIKILKPDTAVSPLSLIQNSKVVLTVRGTAGLEAACYGVPIMTAGSSRYSSFGFTLDSSSKEEFRTNFSNLHSVKSLSPEQVKTARKLAYRIFFQKPLILESINLARDLSKNMSNEKFLDSFNQDKFYQDYIKYDFKSFFTSNSYDIYSR